VEERVRSPQRYFERFLWQSRLVVLVAVIASLVIALGIFFIATVDVIQLIGDVAHYGSAALDAGERTSLRSEVIAQIVDVVDLYLLASIVLIFGLGLYELFISRIEAAENSEFASRLLLIRSLDDLKDRLAKAIIIILIVKFFQYALRFSYQSPVELLYLAAAILLIAGALYLTGHELDDHV
jgi:uncharacterized membrane protein YqhA